MFTQIFQNLSAGIGQLMDGFVNLFLGALNMDLGNYLVMFPLLENIYTILQSIAIGLIAVIAGMKLAMFWFGSFDAGAMQERPIAILLRSFIAAIGVYAGGYILEFMVKLGTVPYQVFLSQDGATKALDWGAISGGLSGGIGEMFTSPTAAGIDLAIALAEFLLIILIAWNVFKLALEVCERYMMVGILVFTSPIAYPTIASKESAQIFKRWWSMFIGSLIMMSASVIFLKLIVNGLNNLSAGSPGAGEFFVRLLIVIATCKIAQRVDSYLQQLGIGVATTGGSMVDDILAVAHAARKIGAMAGGGGGGGKGVLGTVAGRTPLARGYQKMKSDFAAGKTAKESFKAGKDAFVNAYKNNTGLGRTINAVKNAKAHNASLPAGAAGRKNVVAEGIKGGAAGLGKSALAMAAPGLVSAHDGVKTGAQEMKDLSDARKAGQQQIDGARDFMAKNSLNLSDQDRAAVDQKINALDEAMKSGDMGKIAQAQDDMKTAMRDAQVAANDHVAYDKKFDAAVNTGSKAAEASREFMAKEAPHIAPEARDNLQAAVDKFDHAKEHGTLSEVEAAGREVRSAQLAAYASVSDSKEMSQQISNATRAYEAADRFKADNGHAFTETQATKFDAAYAELGAAVDSRDATRMEAASAAVQSFQNEYRAGQPAARAQEELSSFTQRHSIVDSSPELQQRAQTVRENLNAARDSGDSYQVGRAVSEMQSFQGEVLRQEGSRRAVENADRSYAESESFYVSSGSRMTESEVTRFRGAQEQVVSAKNSGDPQAIETAMRNMQSVQSEIRGDIDFRSVQSSADKAYTEAKDLIKEYGEKFPAEIADLKHHMDTMDKARQTGSRSDFSVASSSLWGSIKVVRASTRKAEGTQTAVPKKREKKAK